MFCLHCSNGFNIVMLLLCIRSPALTNLTFQNSTVLLRSCFRFFEHFTPCIIITVSSLYYSNGKKYCRFNMCYVFYPGRKNTRAEVGCSLISYSWIVSVLCFLLRDWYDVYVQKTLAIIPQHHCHTLPNTLTHSSVRGLLIYAWIDFLIYICFVF